MQTITQCETQTSVQTSLVRDYHTNHWWRLRATRRRLRVRRLAVWYIWKSAFRSLRGHIQIQDSRVLPYTDFGPALRCLPDGSLLVPETRTHACSADTSTLEAKYPWVDAVDQRLFLLGLGRGRAMGSAHPGQRRR